MERWKLHVRLALSLLVMAGNRPNLLLFSFMTATAFLSMWISNTATAALMVPILLSMLERIKDNLVRSHTAGASGTLAMADEISDPIAIDMPASHKPAYGTIPLHTHEHTDFSVHSPAAVSPSAVGDADAIVVDCALSSSGGSSSGSGSVGGANLHHGDRSYGQAQVVASSSSSSASASSSDDGNDDATAVVDLQTNAEIEEMLQPYYRYARCILLAVAYSASVGGSTTIIGTGTVQRYCCFVGATLTCKHTTH